MFSRSSTRYYGNTNFAAQAWFRDEKKVVSVDPLKENQNFINGFHCMILLLFEQARFLSIKNESNFIIFVPFEVLICKS